MRWPPRFAFVGNCLALDFAQTGGEGFRARWESWHTPSDLADWAELAPDLCIRPQTNSRDLAQARVLREAIWAVARSMVEGRDIAGDAIEVIQKVAAQPDIPPVWRDGRRLLSDAIGFDTVMSSVARDALTLFGTSLAERLRECENPQCQLMFVDRSRAGKRQWCSMNRCGNLIKVARHRSKQKEKRDDRSALES